MAMSTDACWGGHFSVEPGIFLSNRAFFCRTMHFAVEPGFFLSNECYNNQKHPWGICSCSPIVNFLKVTFYHGMVTLVIFLIKNDLNRHIKHENLLSIYENMDYFQIMLFTVTCWKFQKIQKPYIKRYFYVFFSTNIVEILLKLWADASSGSGAVKAFLQGSSSPSPSPSPSFSIFA